MMLCSPACGQWSISFNPYGLLEPPAATGAGIRYRLNEKFEIGAETSLLSNGLYNFGPSLTGIREIFQVKKFMGKNNLFFIAIDTRYKSLSYRDSKDLYNPVTHDTLLNAHFRAHQYFFGGGFQLGVRGNLSRSGRLQLEFTGGFGIKQKTIDRQGIGKDYRNLHHSIDFNIWDQIQIPGPAVYFPGSLRLIYTFGKIRYEHATPSHPHATRSHPYTSRSYP